MNASDARLLELALKKQRLQFDSEHLRHRFRRDAAVLPPLFTAVDRVRGAWHWLHAHPVVPVAAGVVLLVARPRAVWRWGRRSFLIWQTWRRARRFVDSALQRPTSP